MELRFIILSEVSQKNQHITSLTRGILKNDPNELICKTETDSQTLKINYGYKRGQVGGRY